MGKIIDSFDDVRFVLALILPSRIDQNGVPSELAPVPHLEKRRMGRWGER